MQDQQLHPVNKDKVLCPSAHPPYSQNDGQALNRTRLRTKKKKRKLQNCGTKTNITSTQTVAVFILRWPRHRRPTLGRGAANNNERKGTERHENENSTGRELPLLMQRYAQSLTIRQPYLTTCARATKTRQAKNGLSRD